MMYQAELRGKIPHYFHKSEDILTSNVFSFFKYSNRRVFLFNYLQELGIDISENEAQNAIFDFWPSYDDLTKPDLVLIVGDFYILIEAKYSSSFSEESKDIRAQLVREYYGGTAEAEKLEKKFILLTITAHPFYDPTIFLGAPDWLIRKIVWINWQSVTKFLEKIIEENPEVRSETLDFANDLKNLLIRKRLRSFIGTEAISSIKKIIKMTESFLFFDIKSAYYGGIFEGFSKIVSIKPIIEINDIFFKSANGEDLFSFDLDVDIQEHQGEIFFRRN